jgi:serine/threonine-protein kinase
MERKKEGGGPEFRRIVVLPFANLSPAPDQDYFSDGLTQELIHALTKVEGLQVIAWNTAAQLRGRPRDEWARDQRMVAGVVLEGSVRRHGNSLRITAQLLEASSGRYLWSETYDRRMKDLFAVQTEIASAIAGVLRVRLRAGPAMTSHAGAYDLYLRARHAFNRRTEQGMRESMTLYERAIALDGSFALARVGLADACILLGDTGAMRPIEALARARECAEKALEIAPGLGEAHVSLGSILLFHEWSWEKSGRHYERGIELSPGYATGHHWYGIDHLALRGEFERAGEEIAIAQGLDPLEPSIRDATPFLCFLKRQHSEAAEQYRKMIVESPEFGRAHTGLGRALALMGDYAGALEAFEKGQAILGETPSVLGALGQIHAQHGNRVEAERMLARLEEMATRRYVASAPFALLHLGLGHKEAALFWLECGLERHDGPLTALGVHPAYDDLRGEPGFTRILERIGLA